MSVTSGFFNSLNGDRKYNAEQFSSIFNGLINDGIFASIGNVFTVNASTGNSISIGIGRCWFNSVWLLNDAILPIVTDASEVLLNRYDAVVIEINSNETVRAGSIKLIKGNPASSAQYPTMINTTLIHQYPLAYIYRAAGSSEIAQANITNMIGTSACPYVTGILQVQNIDNIVAQWQSQWSLWTSGKQAEFIAWVNNLKNVLDGETATNLANQIIKIKHVTQVTLTYSGWIGASAPYTQIVSVPDATVDSEAVLVGALEENASAVWSRIYDKAFGLVASGYAYFGAGTATFKVYEKPSVDIVVGLRGV